METAGAAVKRAGDLEERCCTARVRGRLVHSSSRQQTPGASMRVFEGALPQRALRNRTMTALLHQSLSITAGTRWRLRTRALRVHVQGVFIA